MLRIFVLHLSKALNSFICRTFIKRHLKAGRRNLILTSIPSCLDVSNCCWGVHCSLIKPIELMMLARERCENSHLSFFLFAAFPVTGDVVRSMKIASRRRMFSIICSSDTCSDVVKDFTVCCRSFFYMIFTLLWQKLWSFTSLSLSFQNDDRCEWESRWTILSRQISMLKEYLGELATEKRNTNRAIINFLKNKKSSEIQRTSARLCWRRFSV